MSPAPLRDNYVRANRPATITLHQPNTQGAVITHTGTLLGAMYPRGEMHHVRATLKGGVVMFAPPAWVATDSRCHVLQAGLQVPSEWDDGTAAVEKHGSVIAALRSGDLR